VSARGKRVIVGPPDVEDTLVPVPADHLLDWVSWIGLLTTALEDAAETTRFDLGRRLPDGIDLPGLHAALEQAYERIGALLDGDGWWKQR
jgi:hypothetical protein